MEDSNYYEYLKYHANKSSLSWEAIFNAFRIYKMSWENSRILK